MRLTQVPSNIRLHTQDVLFKDAALMPPHEKISTTLKRYKLLQQLKKAYTEQASTEQANSIQ